MEIKYNLADDIYEILDGPLEIAPSMRSVERLATEVAVWLAEAYNEGLMAGREEALGLDA